VLELLKHNAIRATFFVPGHTADHYPDAIRSIVQAGHEVACHGYLHEAPAGLPESEEIEILQRSEEALLRVSGQRPLGYRSPSWELSANTLRLLAQRGYLYESSLMADDFRLYHPASSCEVSTDGRVVFGPPSPLIEFPIAWELDDFVYFQFLGSRNPALHEPDQVLRIWRAEFDYCATEVPDSVFTLTLHPEVIGRGPRIRMLQQLIDHMRSAGARFERMIDVARDPSARLSA
jgi:peptidoglycan/xylan/chitin deacetylase (PgdA/CDA1 family)